MREGQAFALALSYFRGAPLRQGAAQVLTGVLIEQVLLSPLDDSYRVLRAKRGASLRELRRHMALIMR